MAGLNFERLIGSAVMIGGFKDIIALLFNYTKRRVQFRRATNNFQGIQEGIAEIIANYKMARLFSYHCAWELDHGMEPMVDASIAKMKNTEWMREAGTKAIQIMGGDGLTKFYPAERVLREGKIGEIVAGTTEVQKMIIYRFTQMLPAYNVNVRFRWNDEVNAPLVSKKDSKFKGLPVTEENVLKVIAHDYKVNPGLYMTPEDVRDDIGGGRVELKKIEEVLEQKKLLTTIKDRDGKVELLRATYEGLQKAFPKEYFRWFPKWYDESDKF